jgi:hypothetical protein
MVRLEKKIEKTETYLFNIKLAVLHSVRETLLLALRVKCELNLDIHDTTNYLHLLRSAKRKWIFFFFFWNEFRIGLICN